MKKLEDFIKSIAHLTNDDISLLKSEDITDEKFDQIKKKAEEKIAKGYESTAGKTLVAKAKTEAYKRSQIKFRKQMNNKLGLGLSNDDIESFDDDSEDNNFADFVNTAINKDKDELRKGADKETIKELTSVKNQLSKLRTAHDEVLKSKADEIKKIEESKTKEVEDALAENYYNMRIAQNKKIDRELNGINLSLKTIKNELFEQANVDRDGNIESKNGTAFLLDEKVIDTVDEYLDYRLEKEKLISIHNADKLPPSLRDRKRKDRKEGELGEAALKKKRELEASARREKEPEKRSRFS